MSNDIEMYGLRFPKGSTRGDIELECFYRNQTPELGGLGRYQHLHNAIDTLWNEPKRAMARDRKLPYEPKRDDNYIWNDWSELQMDTFANNQWSAVTGPNASWKTTSAALYGLCCFYASPLDTVVVATSTSLPGLRKRIWKEFVKYHRLCPAFGQLNASDYAIRFQRGSDEAGIFGVATGTDNDVKAAVEKIIGFHATNVIAIVDEGQATNEALVDAAISLQAGSRHFQFIILGNADSELDPHGMLCEPEAGWESVSVEDEIWKTKRGVCVHLDGLESPRVKEGDEFYPGLLRKRDNEDAAAHEGEDSPYFWQYRRGFWAPQGIAKVVLTHVDANRFRAREREIIWVSKPKTIATLDPAYEGDDRCALRRHEVGIADIDGEYTTIIFHGELVILKMSVSKDRDPIHYQIAKQVVEHCTRWGVVPYDFGLDTTGEGEGPAGVLEKHHNWFGLLRVDFNGGASDDIVSYGLKEDGRTRKPIRACDKWYNKVTELHFRYRARLRNGQIRGLDRETLLEFCQRRYIDKGNGVIQLEPKKDMKLRTHRSPDLSDNAVIAEEVARKRGYIDDPTKIDGKEVAKGRELWNKLASRYNAHNTEVDDYGDYDETPQFERSRSAYRL